VSVTKTQKSTTTLAEDAFRVTPPPRLYRRYQNSAAGVPATFLFTEPLPNGGDNVPVAFLSKIVEYIESTYGGSVSAILTITASYVFRKPVACQ
jgi:hypothetical protein